MGGSLERALAALRPMPEDVEKRAREWMEDTAAWYDQYDIRAQTAPRRGRGIEELRAISARAAELATLLYDLDPAIRSALAAAIGPGMMLRRPAGFVELHDGQKLTPWTGPPGGWLRVLSQTSVAGDDGGLTATDDVPLWRRLRYLSSFCLRASGAIRDDRGGRTNMVTERQGTPKGQLALAGIDLIKQRNELCAGRPKSITGGGKGTLYLVVGAIYERATGEEPEAPGAGIGDVVRRAARLHKAQADALTEYESLPMECPPEDWRDKAAALTAIGNAMRTL